MHHLRNSLLRSRTCVMALSAVVVTCMLLVQAVGLHMHNHNHEHAGAADQHVAEVHVTGSGSHLALHDINGEIDLAADSMPSKQPPSTMAFALLALAVVVLIAYAPQPLTGGHRKPAARTILFARRPPGHAPPRATC